MIFFTLSKAICSKTNNIPRREERENDRETGSFLHPAEDSWKANGDGKIHKHLTKKMYGLFSTDNFESIGDNGATKTINTSIKEHEVYSFNCSFVLNAFY